MRQGNKERNARTSNIYFIEDEILDQLYDCGVNFFATQNNNGNSSQKSGFFSRITRFI